MHSGIKRQITELAKANPDREICGFIYCDFRNRAGIYPCANVARDPAEDFQVEIQEQIKARSLGTLLGYYHSHPGAPAGFSPCDLQYALRIALPAYLVNSEDSSWHTYVPPTYRVPIEGRQWCLGFHDCYETPRVYYREKLGIHMGDYDRDETFGHEDQGTILANYEREGFVRVESDPATVRVHDVLIFCYDKPGVPQHFGVFAGEGGYMYHHRLHRTSEKQLITAEQWEKLIGVFRHRTLL